MSLPLGGGGRDPQSPANGQYYDLEYCGAVWAHATLSAQADYVTLGCVHPNDPYCFPTRVQVRLKSLRSISCTVYANVEGSLPTATREVLSAGLGGAPRRLPLVDALGRRWAELELAATARLLDPTGRERALIASEHKLTGRRLTLRCWNEAGQQLAGQVFLMP
jgi:hypothetical protein